MTYGEAGCIVFACADIAVFLSFAVHSLVPVGRRARHQEVGMTIFLQLGVLFAVLLAFVFSEAIGQYDEARQAVDQERAALHGAAMLAVTLPPNQAEAILNLELTYLHRVLEEDWPAMRSSRKGNEATEAALVDLTEQAGRLPIAGSSSDAVKSQLLTLLAAVHAESTTRLYAASSGLPVVLWVILIGFSFILTVFVALSSVESRLLLTLFAVTFATCISSILVLVRLLDHPFEGALGISSDGFSETLAKVSMLLHGV